MQIRPAITAAMSIALVGMASTGLAGEKADGPNMQTRVALDDSFHVTLADSYSMSRWQLLRAPTVQDQPRADRPRLSDESLAVGTAEPRWAYEFTRHRVAATAVNLGFGGNPGFGSAETACGERHAFAAPAFDPGTVEDAVRRFHQEGLSIAHLWQTGSTTLSLGLSPRGKPGLWFRAKV